ncbi:MAG: hypothetical protein ABI629_01625 [bacterium]
MVVRLRQRRGLWWVNVYHHGKERAKSIGRDRKVAQRVADQIQA